MDPPTFANHQLTLLTTELHALRASLSSLTNTHSPRQLARSGHAVLNLTLRARRIGLGGKTVVEVGVDPAVSGGGGGAGAGAGDGEIPESAAVRVGDGCVLASLSSGGGGSGWAEERGGRENKNKNKNKSNGKSGSGSGSGGGGGVEGGVKGVVVRVSREGIRIALDGKGEGGDEGEEAERTLNSGGRFWLLKLSPETPHQRLEFNMRALSTLPPERTNDLVRVLLGQKRPSPLSPGAVDGDSESAITWHNPSLDASQKAAVRFALASSEVALLHGPPGTGKTQTLIELIEQLLGRGQRVLVCGPSNVSVDNIVERLAGRAGVRGAGMLRLGHPARLQPSVLAHSLEVVSGGSEAAGIAADVRAEIEAKLASVRKTRSGRERRAVYGEIKELRREYREREARVVGDLVRASRLVLSTLHGAGDRAVRGERFDVVVVDEASQALEAQCWIPVLESRAGKIVLAGDHLQLPPTIMSLEGRKGKGKGQGQGQGNAKMEGKVDGRQEDEKKSDGKQEKKKKSDERQEEEKKLDGRQEEQEEKKSDEKQDVVDGDRKKMNTDGVAKPAKNGGAKSKLQRLTLETTMFDRLLSLHGDGIKRMLTTQYRMHEKIMRFPSAALYEDKLTAAEAVRERLLKELPYEVEETDDTSEPVVFWDTQGDDFPETAEEEDGGGGGKGSLLSESKVNEHEAMIVRRHVGNLVRAGVRAEDIAVITPYNGQLAVLSRMLKERFAGIELGSVDGFQGREKEAVVVSLVRSNAEREVGFLAEKRRLNVAMTRPRRHLCVVGDSETICRGSEFLKSWMAFLEERAELRYPDMAEVAEEA